MVALHDMKLNGILADEMGLGKTVQVSSSVMPMTYDLHHSYRRDEVQLSGCISAANKDVEGAITS